MPSPKRGRGVSIDRQDEESPLLPDTERSAGAIGGTSLRKKTGYLGECHARDLDELFQSQRYDVIMCAVVVLNAMTIGFQIDYRTAMPVGAWLVVNLLFFSVFLVEAVGKILTYGFAVYFHNHWNRFDFLITFACGVEIFASYSVMLSNSSFYQSWHAYVSGDFVQIARLFRLARLARLFPEIGVLLQSFLYSLKALGWIALGALLWFYIAACIVTVFVGRRQFNPAKGNEDIKEIQERTKTVGLSMFVLFEIMTLEGWTDYVRPLLKTNPFFVAFFIFFIFVTAFFLLNLVTAVVVDRTLSAQTEADESAEKQKQTMRISIIRDTVRVFRNLNRGKDRMSKGNMENWVHGDTVKGLLARVQETDTFLITMFSLLDHTQEGEISLDELETLWIAYEKPLNTHNFLRFHINVTRRMEYQERLTFTVLHALEKTSQEDFHLPSELFDKTVSFLPKDRHGQGSNRQQESTLPV